MNDRETRVETYGEELRTHYDDPVYEVVTYLIRTLTKKKVTTPGNFQSYVTQLLRWSSS
jgi:hypothetical protein